MQSKRLQYWKVVRFRHFVSDLDYSVLLSRSGNWHWHSFILLVHASPTHCTAWSGLQLHQQVRIQYRTVRRIAQYHMLCRVNSFISEHVLYHTYG
jgi:hypothetical protein